MPQVVVLRYGHRPARDKRVSTHTALVARAFGANGICFDTIDKELKTSIEGVVGRFGGPFFVEMGDSWNDIIERWQSEGGEIIHLTMYGLPLSDVIEQIKLSSKKKLVVVGSEKVPKEFYQVSDYNVAITNQPHSEIAALCIFLDRFFDGKAVEGSIQFKGAKLKIIPCAQGKHVVEYSP
ncbi:MAG: tRNA (cytidine(56)-2'-O)-methyltransferase [Promethearchaeota archaeon]